MTLDARNRVRGHPCWLRGLVLRRVGHVEFTVGRDDGATLGPLRAGPYELRRTCLLMGSDPGQAWEAVADRAIRAFEANPPNGGGASG